MKYIHVLISAILFLNINARAGSQDAVTGVTVTGGWFPHFINQNSSIPNHNSRLKAKAYLKFQSAGFLPVDSIYYNYYGERGGSTKKEEPNNDENILFDESFTYIYNPSTDGYDNRLYRMQQFAQDGKVETLTYKNWRTSVNEWKDSARYSYLYNNGIMVTSAYEISFGGIWKQHTQSDLSYDAHHNVTSMSSNTYTAQFIYDVNSNLVTMIDSQLTSSGTWTLNEKRNYTYSNNNVNEYRLEKWDPVMNIWINESKWTYTYSGTNITSTLESAWDGSQWVNSALHLYKYDADNNKTEDIRQYWNITASAFVNAGRETWEYNIFGQPLHIISDSWNGNQWVHANGNEEIRFYYEYYFPSDITNTTTQKNELQVYPTIAQNSVNIKLNWATPQSSVISIYDMSGHLARRINHSGNIIDTQVPVSDLASGNYVVNITGATSNLTGRFVVSR